MPFNLHFSIDIDGDRELSRRLDGLLERVTNLAPFFRAVADDWSRTQAAIFAAEGAYEGQDKWAALRGKYAAWKARKHAGKPILQLTGALLKATVHPSEQITDHALKLTIESAYAIYHQSSRPRPSGLPRRPFASLTAKQKSRWMRLLRDHLNSGNAGA